MKSVGGAAGAPGAAGPGHATYAPGWLALLLDGEAAHRLVSHRDDLIAAGSPPESVDEELKDALALRELLDQRRSRVAELAALNDIASRLASVTDVEQLLQEIVDQAKKLLNVDLAYLSLIRDDHITIVVTTGQISGYLARLTMPVAEGFSSAVIAGASPLWTSDYPNDGRFEHHEMADTAARLEDIRGLLGVPMFSHNKVIGVLFAGKRQERTFATDEIELSTSLAAHASVALENSRALADRRRSAEDLQATNSRLEAVIGWDRTLTQVVLRGGDAQDLLSEVSEKAGCPAYFVRSGAELPPALAGITAEARAELLGVGAERESSIEIEAGESALLAMPVAASTDVLGVLVLCRDSGRTRSDHPMIIERAAPSMALLLIGQQAAEEAARKTKDGLLIDLLTRPITDRRAAAAQARLIGVDLTRGYLLVAMLPGHDKAHLRQAVEALALPTGSVVGDYGQQVIALVRATDADRIAGAWFDATELGATIGISGAIYDVADLRGCFRDAVRTVDVMLALNRHGQVGTAEQLGIYRMLLSRGGPHEIDRLFSLHFGAVAEEERRSGVPLLETLDSYLRNSQRHGATAAALNIHPNTLYQRLDKLTGILGSHWREPERALDLQVILRLKHSATRLGEVADM